MKYVGIILALLTVTASAQLRDSDRAEIKIINHLRNGGLERGIVGWVGSGVSPTLVTGSQRSGTYAVTWNPTASTQTLNSPSVEIPRGAGACLAEFYYTGAGTADIQAYVEDTSNNRLSDIVTITTAVTALDYTLVQLPFACQPTGTSVRIELNAQGNAAPIVVDDASFTRDFRVGSSSIGAWQTCTITSTWVTNATHVCKRRAVGDSYDYDVSVQLTGAPTASGLILTMPSDSTIDTSKLANSTEYENIVGTSIVYDASGAVDQEMLLGGPTVASSTTVRIMGMDNATTDEHWLERVQDTVPVTFATGDRVHIRFTVPVTQLASNVVQRADTPGNLLTSYTPTFTGFGTVSTQAFQYQCVGPNLLMVKGRFVAGTVTATEARISLPSGFTSASSYTTLEQVGFVIRTASSTTFFNNVALVEPSVTYLTFGRQNSTNSALGKANGNDAFGTGDTVSVGPAFIQVASGCGNIPRAFIPGSLYGSSTVLDGGSTSVSTFESGTYTPTLTNQSNIAASTLNSAFYVRIGKIVMVSIQVQIDPTATGSASLVFTLPVATANFPSTFQATGVGASSGAAGNSGRVLADSGLQTARFTWDAASAANLTYSLEFKYQVQ